MYKILFVRFIYIYIRILNYFVVFFPRCNSKNDKERSEKVIYFKVSIIQSLLGIEDVIETWRHLVTCMVSYDSHIIIKTFIILPYDSYCIYEWIYLRSQWVIVRGIAISRDESLSHQELIDYSWWISFATIWMLFQFSRNSFPMFY